MKKSQIVCLLASLWLVSACGADSVPAEDQVQATAETEAAPPEVQLRDLAFATLAPPTIAIIQQSPTPLPTATATPTATPIVYAIEAGDTLLAIAIDNRTTVEEIQALNPNVRPELLSIGQQISLPPPATPVFSGDQPTPLPIQTDLKSVSLFPDGAGGLWVLGEVSNTADYFLENARLEITLFGANGLEVGQGETWSAAALIGPGETAPFSILFPQKPAGNLQASVKVINGFTILDLPQNDNRYFRLTAAEPSLTSEGNVVTIEGKIANEGGQVTTQIVAIATVYDSSRRLIGFAKFPQEGSLNPGDEADYKHVFIVPGGQPDHVEIQLYSYK
ncbi:MAG: FxLYD domain-containing protein [Anaerolineae bacterium]